MAFKMNNPYGKGSHDNSSKHGTNKNYQKSGPPINLMDPLGIGKRVKNMAQNLFGKKNSAATNAMNAVNTNTTNTANPNVANVTTPNTPPMVPPANAVDATAPVPPVDPASSFTMKGSPAKDMKTGSYKQKFEKKKKY